MDRDKVARDLYFKPLIYQFSDYRTHTKLWSIPKDSAAYAVYFNKALFDKAGVPYPKDDWSFQDFRNAAKMLTVDKNGRRADSAQFDKGQIAQWGFTWLDPLPSGDSMNQLAWSWFGNWYNDDFTKAYYDTPEAVEYLQFFADMRCVDRSIPAAGDALGQGDPFRNQITAMQIGHHSMVFFYNAEKKTFKFDAAYSPTGKGGSWSAVACSGFGVPVKAKNPEEGWQLVKYLTSEEKQCEIVSAKRWGSATVACEKNLLPNDNNPPSFKKVLVDPMYKAQGQATEIKTEAKGMIFPPFHNDIKQIFVTEFDAVSNCGGVKASDAVKKMQPQIQALLDKAAKG
jgi:multiple sugar transport system substrate-binding protein